jgi:hypothetical protein
LSSPLKASHRRKARESGARTALVDIQKGHFEPRFEELELDSRLLADDVGFPAWEELEPLLEYDDYCELVATIALTFEQAYNAKFAQVETCSHEWKSRGLPRSWGASDTARCVNCGVHIMSGSTLI